VFLRKVEQVQLELLAAFGLSGERVKGKTGVWQHNRKLGSVGIAVRQWISYHGFALNVSTDLRFFELINPCGFDAGVMSSMSQAANTAIVRSDVESHIPAALNSVFGQDVIRVSEKRLPPSVRESISSP
jgi:lipoyl(octanoyl) transferase